MYLVTGGAGFIGSHIVESLVADGLPVRAMDNFATGFAENLAPFGTAVELIEGDIRDAETLRRAMTGVEVVFHEAAEISVPKSIADPAGTYEVNLTGTLRLLLAARDAGVRKVVLASTSAVYGDDPTSPKRESLPTSPISPYAASKLATEGMAQLFSAAYGVETVALRYFNVYGPRQRPDSAYAAVIPKFVDALTRGERPVIFGDGGQTRDFIYVSDVARANRLAAVTPGLGGRVFNVATGTATSLLDLLEEIGTILGRPVTADHQPARPGDIRDSLANVDAIEAAMGFRPRVSLADGLRQTLAARVSAVR